MNAKLAIALLACLLYGCTGQAPGAQDEWVAWRAEVERSKIRAELFPQAAAVRLYSGALGVRLGEDGRVSATERGADRRLNSNAPPQGGDLLSEAEIDVLRKSVFHAPPPPAIATCFIPRHIFVFQAKDETSLGYLALSFECQQARIGPSVPPDPKRNWIVWDMDAIGQIVHRHGLTTVSPELPAMSRGAPSSPR